MTIANAGSAQERLAALQQTLAGEHAAVWAGGRAAARMSGADRAAALAALEVNRRARDRLAELVQASGGRPVPAAAAYEQPVEVTGPQTARDLMARVTSALCPLYADLAGASQPQDRVWPLKRCRDSALAALTWGAAPLPFPGSGYPGSATAQTSPSSQPQPSQPQAS